VASRRIEEGVSPGEVIVERGTEVRNAQGTIGQVDHILVDPNRGDLAHIIVDRGLLARPVIVPATEIREINQDVVYVDLRQEEVRALPRYRTRRDATELTDLEGRRE
jgi:sporulation protein YlmC with PRC-barrel domain